VSGIAGRFGRRGAMLGGVATMMAAAVVLAAWQALPGLPIGAAGAQPAAEPISQ
jgi:hypothetical protein